MDRDHVEDEDAYQECFEGEIDSEADLDFGDVYNVAPALGLYESIEAELPEEEEDDPDPFIDDLMEEEESLVGPSGTTVFVNINELLGLVE